MLNISHLHFVYGKSKQILDDISLSAPRGSFSVLLGASGSGKSTLLKLLAGLEQPTKGEVRVEGRTALVFQNGALLPWRTLEENVTLVLEASGLPLRERAHRARTELTRVGLADFIHKYPREVSGGQRQRVGLARALSISPEILLLDEPFSALDAITAERLRQDLKTIWKELQLTVMMVSHSVEEAVELADTIYILKDGRLREPITNFGRTHEECARLKHLL